MKVTEQDIQEKYRYQKRHADLLTDILWGMEIGEAKEFLQQAISWLDHQVVGKKDRNADAAKLKAEMFAEWEKDYNEEIAKVRAGAEEKD